MHDHLRNYNWLREGLHTAMEDCLSGAPVYLKLEARYMRHASVCVLYSVCVICMHARCNDVHYNQ